MNDYEEIMNSAKYNIETQIYRAYQQGYEDAKSELGKNIINLTHEERDIAYQQGLEDAWEAARKLAVSSREGGLAAEIVTEIFDGLSYYMVLKDVSASEAIAKIKEYEQQKQDTIKVWDEVYSEIDDLRFIVTRIITSKHMDITVKRYEGICTDGACYDNLPEDIVKTGRTFPQISEVLAEMRGESE